MTHSPDLYALIIRLTASQNGRLRATQGHLAHAAFLHILQQVDPAISAALHDQHGRKPFTISPLEGYGLPHKGTLPITAGQEGWLRVTLLAPSLFQTFISYFLHGTHKPIIQLENLTFHVTEILNNTQSHKLAGYTNLQNLRHQWVHTEPTQHHTIALQFRTPTAFSIRRSTFRHMHVLPDPSFVFGELASYWDKLTNDNTCEDVRSFCTENVVVARHKIETYIYQYRHSKQIGFVGKVAYEILDKEAIQMIQHLNRLADLAFYTGVGSKTAQGMGQVIRLTYE